MRDDGSVTISWRARRDVPSASSFHARETWYSVLEANHVTMKSYLYGNLCGIGCHITIYNIINMYIYIYPCRYRLWLYHIVIYGNPIWWKSHEIPISWEYASQLIAMELTRTSAAVTNWTPQGEIRCRNSDDSRFHVFCFVFFFVNVPGLFSVVLPF